jgi:multimeric flavodoxin WrbA/uncharacterized Zn finger protein (UPF0148 family)
MKLLGVTCGRKMGNSEILAKEALMGAEEVEGVGVELLRLHDLTIKPCTGCESCVRDVINGGTGECVIKDDGMPFLIERFSECDAIIYSYPVYYLSPPGVLRSVNDRMVGYNYKAARDGTKRRVGGLIAVGGTDWVTLGLPLLLTNLQSSQVEVVDHLQAVFSARPGQVLLDDKAVARARALGRHVAEAWFKKDGEAKFMGDEPGHCPVCHTSVLLVPKNGPVECAICGSRGTLKVEGDAYRVAFYEEDIKKSRWYQKGFSEHLGVVHKVHEKAEQGKDVIKSKLSKYKSYDPIIKTPPKAG